MYIWELSAFLGTRASAEFFKIKFVFNKLSNLLDI